MSSSRIRKSAGGMCLVSCLILVMLTTVLQVPVLAATVPQQPVLLAPGIASPPGLTTTARPMLIWSTLDTSVNAVAIAISREPYGPANVIYRTGWISGRPASYTLSRDLDIGRYRWQIEVRNAAGTTLSNRLYFQVSAPTPTVPPQPVLSSPAHGAAGVAVTAPLSWQPVSGAASYEIIVSRNSAFTDRVFSQSGITATSVSVSPALAANTQFWWAVRAGNAAGVGSWSIGWTFTTTGTSISPPTTPPTHLSPSNGATGVSLTPVFRWQPVGNTTKYGLYIRDTSTNIVVFSNEAITGTSFTLSSGILREGITYQWNMLAGNSAGWGPASTVWGFTTTVPQSVVPTVLSLTGLTPATITTSTAPHDAALSLSGSGFNRVNQVVLSWSGAANGSATWNRGDARWNAGVSVGSDAFMTLTPRVVEPSPAWSGTAHWTVTLRDTATGATAERTFTVTYVVPPPTVIQPTQRPTITASVNPTSITSGQSATLSWSTTHATSLSISPDIGAVPLSGTRAVFPTSNTTYTFIATGAGGTATATVTSTVTAPSRPAITTDAALSAKAMGAAYSTTLAASGGTPPYRWSLGGGSLPPGLSLSSGGVISGTPTAPGTYSFTVQVRDSQGRTAQQAFSLTVTLPQDLREALASVAASTAFITVTLLPEGHGTRMVSSGTGVVVRGDGYIVTNRHVVEEPGFNVSNLRATVRLTDGSIAEFPALVVTKHASLDLALIKVDPGQSRLRAAKLEDVKPGERVVAIGNPSPVVLGGPIEEPWWIIWAPWERTSVTLRIAVGVVIALAKQCPEYILWEATPWYVAQERTFNVTFGYSGGPLADSRGAVVGINTKGHNGLTRPELGLAFVYAIPSAEVRAFLESALSPIPSIPTPPKPPTATVVFYIGSRTYSVGEESRMADTAPYLKGGRAYVPLRPLAEALGVPSSAIVWDELAQKVTLTKGTTKVELWVGSTTIRVNGQTRPMGVAPELKDGRVYLPARFVANALGYGMRWDKAEKRLTLKPAAETAEAAIDWALKRLGWMEWSGRCYSFVRAAFNAAGLSLPAAGEIDWTRPWAVTVGRWFAGMGQQLTKDGVPPRGALIFYDGSFTTSRGRVWQEGHVGISLGDGRIVHALGSVRVSDNYLNLSSDGVLNASKAFMGWTIAHLGQ